MAAKAPAGPGDDTSAILDELTRNFTYWAPGAGNGSLSSEWYRRNQSHLFGVFLIWDCHVTLLSHLPSPNNRGFILEQLLMVIFFTGSAIISVVFLKENLRASDLLGMTLAFAGMYLLVNFAPNITQAISARAVQYYFVGWQFLVYVILEILAFCILLYFHKRKGMKHIVILLTLVALLASLTVISVKAVSGMITFSMMDKMQLTYPIFYIMFVIMIASCVFQVKFLNQATKLYTKTTVVPVNHVFFTTSAIVAGIVFYQEFLGATFLAVFIYFFGCFLSFLGVFLVTRNREKEQSNQSFIDFGNIPGKQTLDKIQPDSNGISYGTLPDGNDSTKSQGGEKKEV
uniref:NIPA-like domain containing 2 n=1 Tax=Nannospalax galili TaxID=1026970 RepID=A0A8C6RQM8_NANGA